MNASDSSDESDKAAQKITKLADGVEADRLIATNVARECKRLGDELGHFDAEDLRRGVARELMDRDDNGDLADVVREIISKTDVKMDPYEDIPPCPGCGHEWGQASHEYRSCDYGPDDETWCRECAFEDREDIERVGDRERVSEFLAADELEQLQEETESGTWQEAIEVADAAIRPEGHGARYCPNCYAFAEWRPIDHEHAGRRCCAHCGATFVDDEDVVDSYEMFVGTAVMELSQRANADGQQVDE